MRMAMIVGLMALAGWGARGGQSADTPSYSVTAYVQDHMVADPRVLGRAESLATLIFAEIGVRLRWEFGAPRPARGRNVLPDAEVILLIAARTPAGLHPGAPAYALPYAPESGVRVTIFYDRVLALVAGGRSENAVHLLGHILAHEIGHALQGVVRHSEAGIMKAQWTLEERIQMRMRALSFTDHDVSLIRASMDKRQRAILLAAR